MGWNPFTWGGNQVMGSEGYGAESIGGGDIRPGPGTNYGQEVGNTIANPTIINPSGPVDSGAEVAANELNVEPNIDNQLSGSFDWVNQFGPESDVMKYVLEGSKDKNWDPSTGDIDPFGPGWFGKKHSQWSDQNVIGPDGLPMTYPEWKTMYQSEKLRQGQYNQELADREKPGGKFKWGQGLLDAAQSLTDSAGNIEPYKYDIF